MQARVPTVAILNATAPGDPGLTAAGSSRYETPIANRPLIAHVLGEMTAAGIDEVRLVTRAHLHQRFIELLGSGSPPGVRIAYLEVADEEDAQAAILREAAAILGEQPVILHPADSLGRGRLRTMCDRFALGDVECVLPDGAAGDDPGRGEADATELPMILGPGTAQVVAELSASAPPTPHLVEALLTTDVSLGVVPCGDYWYYADSTEALLAGNRLVLDQMSETEFTATVAHANRVDGRVHIDVGATVSNSVVHGPVVIAEGALVEDSFVGPYTAIGPHAVLSGVEIDNSMVLTQAEVQHPGSRLEGCIIGEHARIARSFGVPSGLHLRLAVGSHVRIS